MMLQRHASELVGGGSRGKFLLRLREPVGVILFTHHAEGDGHIGVILAANLRALAVIRADALGQEPGFVQAAGHRVDADAESRNGERVDHVGGGDLDADFLADRHDRFIVHREQPDVALGRVSRVSSGCIMATGTMRGVIVVTEVCRGWSIAVDT